jgi:hypothetical protein
LQADGEGLLAAEGRGDEAVQLGQAQEAAQGAQPGGPGEVEDEVGGQHEPAQEAVPGGAVQEGRQRGLEAGVLPAAQPVPQGVGR